MQKLELHFSDHRAVCVFPDRLEQLPQALDELELRGRYSVIVLVGGFIQEQHAGATQKAIEIIAASAEEKQALIICGGSDLGVMGSIGQTRAAHGYIFPLLGINLKNLVSWPEGPRSKRFLWWGTERWPLSTGYSHFILVPGNQYGEDSPWIAEAATCLSQGDRSVTIVANGGSVTRKDISLSLALGRPVLALAGTGRLADELAKQSDKPILVMTVQAEDENALRQALQLAFQPTRRTQNDFSNKKRTND
jgi:hypothetical protein